MTAYPYVIMMTERPVPLLKVRQDIVRILVGIDDTQRETRWLLQELFSLSFKDLLNNKATLTPTQYAQALATAQRRKAGEPLARIIGKGIFWGEHFKITPDVLEPRTDSESLLIMVQRLITHLPARPRIIDFGTGSGCLLISTIKEIKDSIGVGVDKSIPALHVAAANAYDLGVHTRVQWVASDWDTALTGQFDLMISNPPYIKSKVLANLEKTVLDYDPIVALDGGEDGLNAYRRLIPAANKLLRHGGIALFEIGFDQGQGVPALVHAPLHCREVIKDMSGRDRLVFLEKPA